MYGAQRQIDKWKAVIRKYVGRYGMLAPCEAEELEQAYESIKNIQSKCYHMWIEGSLFTSSGRVCRECDLPERDYSKK